MCDNITNGYFNGSGGNIYVSGAPSTIVIESNILSTTGNIVAANIISRDGTFTGNLSTSNYVTATNLTVSGNIISGVTGSTFLLGNLIVSGSVYSLEGQVSRAVYYTLLTTYTPSHYTGSIYGKTYNLNLNDFNASCTSSSFSVSPQGYLLFSQTGIYQITGVFFTNFDNVNGIAIGHSTIDGTPDPSQAYLYRYVTTISQNPTEPLTVQISVTSTTMYYYIDIFAVSDFILQPTASSHGGTWITVSPYTSGSSSQSAVAASGLYTTPSPDNSQSITDYLTSLVVPSSFWSASQYPAFSCIMSTDTKSFFGGICLPTGRVLFAPFNTPNPGIYNPLQDQYSDMTVSPTIPSKAYNGGVLLPSGKIVFIPYNSPTISLYINESTTLTNPYTHNVPLPAFSGGVLDPYGNVTMIPFSTTSNICTYNPDNNTFSNVVKIHADGTFSGGVLLPNGNIVCVSNTNSNICQFDPYTRTVSNSVQGSGYTGGVLVPNGNVILIGSNVGVFNPSLLTFSNINTHVGINGFSGGCLLPTGKVVLAPLVSSNVGLVDPVNLTYSNSTPVPGNNPFSGATLLFDGRVVFTPYDGYVGVLSTLTPAPSREFCLSPYFNKF